MRRFFLLCIGILVIVIANAQIMSDSTVQAVAYWQKGEKHTYELYTESYNLSESDTTNFESTYALIDILVLDSTANGYTISWKYRDCSFRCEDELTQAVYEKMLITPEIIAQTNELGVVQSVLNWKAISKLAKKNLKKIPNLVSKDQTVRKAVKASVEKMTFTYETEQNIWNNQCKDLQLFYFFHGGQYNLHQPIVSEAKVSNNFNASKPFDAEVTLLLDSIYKDDNDYLLRYSQTVNQEQLLDAVYEFLKQLSSVTGSKVPEKSEFSSLRHYSDIVSVMHASGWPEFCKQNNHVSISPKKAKVNYMEISFVE